jgi:hypothetical protein
MQQEFTIFETVEYGYGLLRKVKTEIQIGALVMPWFCFCIILLSKTK